MIPCQVAQFDLQFGHTNAKAIQFKTSMPQDKCSGHFQLTDRDLRQVPKDSIRGTASLP